MADYTSARRFAAFCERHPQEWSFSAGNVEKRTQIFVRNIFFIKRAGKSCNILPVSAFIMVKYSKINRISKYLFVHLIIILSEQLIK